MRKAENTKQIKKELELLRSFVIGVIGKDKEGEYRPEMENWEEVADFTKVKKGGISIADLLGYLL